METKSEDTQKTPVSKIVPLTRPVPASVFSGDWFDIFHRVGPVGVPDTWVLWSPVPPGVATPNDVTEVSILGEYLDEYRARNVANTMLSLYRKELSLMPTHAELLVGFLEQGLEACTDLVVDLADYLPVELGNENAMTNLTTDEVEALTVRLESMNGSIGNWMLVQVSQGSPASELVPIGTQLLVRLKEGKVMAAVPFCPTIYTEPEVQCYCDGKPRRFICVDPQVVPAATAKLTSRFGERLLELTSRLDAQLAEDHQLQTDNSAVEMVGPLMQELRSMHLSAFLGHRVSQLADNIFGTTVKLKIKDTVTQ